MWKGGRTFDNLRRVLPRFNGPLLCFLAVLCILLFDYPQISEACPHHSTGDMVKRMKDLTVSQTALNAHAAADKAWGYMEQNLKREDPVVEKLHVRQMGHDASIDTLWMKEALSAAMGCYGRCPPIPYGSVLVNKTSGRELMRSCNTAYLDATNHAEMNTLQMAAHYYPGRSRQWWNELTLYTTAEPCAMCMAASRWVGIGEIVYGTSISTQSSLGWGSIHISAASINAQSYELPSITDLDGPFATSLTDPYFSWQFNPSVSCPPGCVRASVNSTRCV